MPESEVIREFEDLLAAQNRRGAAHLVSFWRSRNPASWGESLDVFQKLGSRLLDADEILAAYDVADAGLKRHPQDLLLLQLLARALVRIGSVESAHSVVLALRAAGHEDEKTLALLGRTHKDLAEAARDPATRNAHLNQAFDAYYEAYLLDPNYWTGINAATLALLRGMAPVARNLAEAVRKTCPPPRDKSEADYYWKWATLAEASLILEDRDEAAKAYALAAESARGLPFYLQTTRRNARMILAHQGHDAAFLDTCFRMPPVVTFVGHMIDRPGRNSLRIPRWLEASLRKAISERLNAVNPGFGYCSAACGSDILFAEEMLARGAQLHIILPHDTDRFIEESVAFVSGSNWKDRFTSILAKATHVTMASEFGSIGGGAQYSYANQVVQGLAMIRARYLESPALGLAVWDGKPAGGAGGTAETVARWRKCGLAVEIIDPIEVMARLNPALAEAAQNPVPSDPVPTPAAPATGPQVRPTFRSDTRGLLFADAVGFSKLREDEILKFVEEFLGLVANVADRYGERVLLRNTWGDGLYLVLVNVRDTGLLALDLCDEIARVQWTTRGFREDLRLRVGLHAGPVHECDDPVTGRKNFVGTHVSRTARIEPIAPKGGVYASEQFAAIAAVEGVTEFSCNYVGQAEMAKNYGVFATYAVVRNTAVPLTACSIGTP